MDRASFNRCIRQIEQSDCLDHGGEHVLTDGHTHFVIYRFRNHYWKFIFTCDHARKMLFVHAFQYCDNWLARSAIGGSGVAVERILGTLRRVKERFDGRAQYL